MYFTNGMIFLIDTIFSLYIYIIILRILLELMRADYYNPLCQFILKLTDKPIKILQKILPRLHVIDFPAVILLLIVETVKLALFCLLLGIFPSTPSFLFSILSDLLGQLIGLYCFMIIAFTILSWVQNSAILPLMSVLFCLINPLIKPIRRFVPLIAGIDLSPLIALIILYFIYMVIVMPMAAKGLPL